VGFSVFIAARWKGAIPGRPKVSIVKTVSCVLRRGVPCALIALPLMLGGTFVLKHSPLGTHPNLLSAACDVLAAFSAVLVSAMLNFTRRRNAI